MCNVFMFRLVMYYFTFTALHSTNRLLSMTLELYKAVVWYPLAFHHCEGNVWGQPIDGWRRTTKPCIRPFGLNLRWPIVTICYCRCAICSQSKEKLVSFPGSFCLQKDHVMVGVRWKGSYCSLFLATYHTCKELGHLVKKHLLLLQTL